ncbi:T9SS type B sorting domain-containing protein [Winogradskyella sp. A3E31]|uniref:T9SS type B sorting domain-containing protein n=1 Tax=Winogradskyella sp. A3E31 TaxID=3349637 RepID=UPI00398A7102
MKKPTYLKTALVVLFALIGLSTFAQTYEPFTPRKQVNVKGSMLVIGNTILGQDNQNFNDLTQDNQDIDMQYIDIDGDTSTFSSSSADLVLQPQEDGSPTTCYRVAYAALYWGAVLQSGDRSDITNVKFKLPGSSTYNDINGELIYDAIVNPIVSEPGEPGNTPYACFAEVTDLMETLTDIEGTYTMADINSSLGFNNSTGLSAGWSLVVIYEDPNLHTKSFTTYDGFSHIYDGHQETVPVSGFTTPPAGPIDLQFAYGTLDGDRTKRATKLEINGKEVTTPFRSANKFFGSVIENYNGVGHPRNPFSQNTLGYDTGMLEIFNAEPEFIRNGDTNGDFRLQVARGQADPIFAFFTAFAVDIIAPDIDLTKIVLDENGNDIDGDDVVLGQTVFYEITYQNVGNDDVTNFTITDILPDNIIFDPATDIDLTNAGGATLLSYDPGTRTIVFSVPDESVEVNDPEFVIRLRVQVVPNCYDLAQACSNEILNQAFATYQGVINPTVIEEEGSFATVECLGEPGPTNFIVDISNCNFENTEILCGDSVTLTAADGYDTYSWSTSPTGTPVVGTNQTYTATETGTYYVTGSTIADCLDIEEIFNVITYGSDLTNPVIPYADEVVICPNDGKELPLIFLCGANDEREIFTGISDAVSIIWEQLDETSCPPVGVDDCANENDACTWNQVGTGPDFVADTAGQFRLVINYPGGCFNIFYFNVYTNLLEPTVTANDILCTTPGQITVGGVPSGYEYSLDPNGPWQTSNVFTVNTPGFYTVYIRQIGVNTNPCIFETPEVYIRLRDFNVTSTVIQPVCYDDQGTIILAVNDALPQYYYSIYEGGTLVNSVGPTPDSDYTFANLNPGTYTVEVSTDDGCFHTEDIEIIQPPELSVTAALTVPLTCTDGEITIYPEGGTPPYTYFINSTTVSQDTPVYPVTDPGTYDITVYDFNSCSATTSITVEAIEEPDFNVNHTDISCPDSNDGSITVNVTNANGNTVRYSIDNGATFFDSPVFTGLPAGDYDVVVEYTTGPQPCTTAPILVTITAPDPITGSAAISAPYTCTSDATITVTGVTGGTAPYDYSIDGVNFQPGNSFSGLTPGTYTVTVQDANDCSFIAGTITIDQLVPITDMTFSETPITCPSNTSDVTITSVTGGSAPYDYQIIAPASAAIGYQASNTFSGLAPGTYTFEVRDANDCTYIESYTIAPLPPLTVNVVLDKDLDCTASPDAVISGIISGSFPHYTVTLIQGSGTVTVSGNTFTFTTPTAGDYQFEVTDDIGCTAQTGIVTITDPVAVTANLSSSDPTCNGDNDGSITLTGLTGQAPFTYSIDGGATFVSTTIFGGLPAGTYDYVVMDSLECTVSGSVTLVDPLPIDVSIVSNPIQCNPTVLGSLDVTINSGGVAPFAYTLYDNTFTQVATNSTSATTYTFSGLDFGDYFVTITDASGCEYSSAPVRIETPPSINVTGNASTGSCATGAFVDLQVVSGTGPFTYSIFGQPATSFGPTPSTTHTFNGLDHGVTYQFQVIDGGGCYSIVEVTTPTISAIQIDPLTTSDVNCFGDSDGTVSFTVSNYDASVTSLYYEVRDQLTNMPIVPAQNGIITGLTGAPVSDTITGLPAGTYTLFVRESDGTLCTVSRPFQITQPVQPLSSVVADIENANCNTNAQITLTTTGGTGPYEYAVGAPGFVPTPADFGPNNVIDLDPSIRTNWDIVVRDANGCEVRLNETISIDPEPFIAASTTNQCTAIEGGFEIDVTMTSPGVGPYTYSIDGGAFQAMTAPFTITNLASGSHTIEVSDANGCGNLVTVDILAPLDLIPEVTALPSCNNDDGEITLTPSGGSGSYSYSISPNPASISISGNVISGVPAGTYTITMTDTVTSCTDVVEIVVPEAVPLTFTTVPTAVVCFGDNSGSFEMTINGYTGPYTYDVFDSTNTSVTGIVAADTSTNPETVTGLQSGTYTVVVTETASPFCSATETVIISSPFEALSLTATETSSVTCDNDSGTITAVASGGWGDYEYELTGAATVAYSPNGTFTGLSAGSYTVNVRDAEGCIASENVILSIPPPINATVTPSTTTLACYGDTDATITISNVTGGQGTNYTYTLNTLSPVVSSSGPQTSPVFTGLGAGTYNVDVTDGYNCIFNSVDITITEPSPIEVDLVLASTPSCLTDATLTLSATGGTGTYSYSDTENFATTLGTFTSSVTFSVQPGTHVYYVRDANGCTSNASNTIEVEELEPLTLELDTTNSTINCAGDSTGVIVAEAQGGLGNYVYTLQDGAGTDIPGATQDSPGVFTGLPVGTYQVYVESGDCDYTSEQVTITEPSAPLLVNFTTNDITCTGSNDGIITVNASGGTGIIKYAISPQMDQFFEEPVFDDLAPGDYQIIVQDELGCYEIIDVTINDAIPVILSIVPNSMFPEVCEGDMNGEFSIEISGGTLPYSVALDDINGTYTTGTATQTQFTFTGLSGGDHVVFVRDAQGCESEWNITFPPAVTINPEAIVEFSCVNNLSTNTVTVLTDESNDPADLDYSLNGGPYQTSNTFNDVPPGVGHYVDVRHTNGCIQRTEPFDIESYEPLEIRLQEGDHFNEIIAIATGGTGIYEYSLNGESYGTTNIFIIYESGNYTVTVTDSNGCVASASGFFEYVDVCIPNYFTPNGDGVLDGWGPGCADQYRDLTFDIFDRYGRKIATLNVDEKWDGKYDGKELPTGDYWYVVRLNDTVDQRDFVGHFTLYR